jgi:hypothetical protein
MQSPTAATRRLPEVRLDHAPLYSAGATLE